jgi:hypothetical protein
MSKVPTTVMDAISQVIKYASGASRWNVVKNELLRCLHSNDRKLFSTRDPLTKQQSLNEMEREIVALWLEFGGNDLLVR